MVVVPASADAKGILNPLLAKQKFELTCHAPSPDLAYFVERYWIIHWDLRGQTPHVQDILPFPSVNLTIEAHRSGIFGVVTGKFTRQLTDTGRVVSVKFRPGGFYPFAQQPISEFTNRVAPIEDVFGKQGIRLEQTILATRDDDSALAQLETFLRAQHPSFDPNIDVINDLIKHIIADRSMTRVDELAAQVHMNKRSLQRLFNQYVGVSPKWVIQRHRLQDAAEQLIQERTADCTDMALRLGYFDLAHFIKDFKTIVGFSPAEYARRAGANP